MPEPELEAMGAILSALEPLDEPSRARVLRWAADKLEIGDRLAHAGSPPHPEGQPTTETAFSDVGDVIEAASPTTGPERAMAVGYWLQEVDGRVAGWGGRELNDTLKNLGHPLANVTKTLESLRDRKPQLVMQVARSGRGRQGRKTYKLTTAGVAAVQRMIADPQEEG